MKGLGLKEAIVGAALALTPAACKSEADIQQHCIEIGQETREKTSKALVGTGDSCCPTLQALYAGEKETEQCLRENNLN